MIFEHQGICPHCGQVTFVTSSIANPDDALLMELAEENCDCSAARLARGMKNTETRIQGMIGASSTDRGFDYSFPTETIEDVRAICKMILREEVDKVTFTEKNGDTIRLVRDGNAVKVKRSTKLQMEL